MMPGWAKMLVPVFLAGQCLAVYWTTGVERLPAAPPLRLFPASFGGWTASHDDAIPPEVANALRADRLLSRTYANRSAQQANLLLAWFASQRAGTSQPHSPKVCLPASGWTAVANDQLTVPAELGAIAVNRYVVASGDERAVVLYWYETSRGPVSGEWAAKLMLISSALRDRRTDTALVRVVVEDAPGGDEAATRTGAAFVQCLYPVLHNYLPH